MALINQERSGLCLESLLLPLVRLWIPNLRRENLGLLILYYALSPCRDSLAFATFPVHLHLVEVTVLQCLLRKLQLPVARVLQSLGTILLCLLPVVEVADEIDICSVRRPLTEHPSLLCLVKAEVFEAVGKIAQGGLAVVGKLAHLPEHVVVAAADSILVVCQVRIVLYKSYMFNSSSLGCFLAGSLLAGCLLAGCLLGCCLLSCSLLFCCHGL